jgi:hypothetical protein
MTFRERLSLLAFGAFAWASAVMTLATPHAGVFELVSPVQTGLAGLCLGAALLPGRMARFSR